MANRKTCNMLTRILLSFITEILAEDAQGKASLKQLALSLQKVCKRVKQKHADFGLHDCSAGAPPIPDS